MKTSISLFVTLIISIVSIYSQSNLTVDGDITIGQASENPAKGTIRFNTTTQDFEGWNGTHWLSLTAGHQEGSVTDVEGNTYRTIKIGDQEWMAENLRTKRYRDGTLVTLTQSNGNWQNADFGAYCWYNNDAAYEAHYGKLYNGFTIGDGLGLCPTGWHVPSQVEFEVLAAFLQGTIKAGGKMKEVAFWNEPNTGATNSSGFSGLPGGIRTLDGVFQSVGTNGYWWCNQGDSGVKLVAYLNSNIESLGFSVASITSGMSVRCVKGNPPIE